MKKQFPKGFFSKSRPIAISKKDALDIIISAVGVADMGKQRWFEQEDGSWYDRMECDYVSLNKVVDRVCEAISELDSMTEEKYLRIIGMTKDEFQKLKGKRLTIYDVMKWKGTRIVKIDTETGKMEDITDRMSTIDAIPIEWIEKHISEIEDDVPNVAGAFKGLIVIWRVEQEKANETD